MSVLAHAAVLVAVYGAHLYGVTLKYGMLELDWDESYENKFAVAMVDTGPLRYPPGLVASREPKRRDRLEPRPSPERRIRVEPKTDLKQDNGGEQEGDQHAAVGNRKFGKLYGNAFKPHLDAIYAAYEQGRVPSDPFTVAVTCRVRPDGGLTEIRLATSSGMAAVDNTALNLLRELSEMKALGPLASLSSLSLTLDRGSLDSTLTAVGFASSEVECEDLARELRLIRSLAGLTAANEDQAVLIRGIEITRTGHRVTVRLTLPNGRAGEMMHRSFSSQAARS